MLLMVPGGGAALALLLALAWLTGGEASVHQTYETDGIRYSLVAITNGGTINPPRNSAPDTSDPAVGEYVFPLEGRFSYLRFECGYKYHGPIGYVELSGSWYWEPGGFLRNLSTAFLLQDNAYYVPTLPGYPGDGVHTWQNARRDTSSGKYYYGSFGVTAFEQVDGSQPSFVMKEYSCDPGGNGMSNNVWVGSSDVRDTTGTRYVRLWLGQEVAGFHYSATWDQVTWYLVGITNGGDGTNRIAPPKNLSANADSEWLGEYVKPRWGRYTHLQYDCGYAGEGNIGLVRLAGGDWQWKPSFYLSVHTIPVTKLAGNAHTDPFVPGTPGFQSWTNFNYPTGGVTFGFNGFREVDGRGSWSQHVFACDPTVDPTTTSNYTSWAPPANQYNVNNMRYIRLWLGVEEVGWPTVAPTSTISSTSTTRTESTTTSSSTTATLTTTLTTRTSTTTSRTTSTTTTMSTTTTSSTTGTSTATGTATRTTTNTTTIRSWGTLTTTTRTTTPEGAWDVKEKEASLIAALQGGGDASLDQDNGTTVLVQRLSAAAPPEGAAGGVEVNVPGTQVQVRLPGALVQGLDLTDVALAVTAFNSTVQVKTGSSYVSEGSVIEAAEGVAEVQTILSVSLVTVSNTSYIHVDHLSAPILVVLPANFSAGLSCSSWDETNLVWTSRGLTSGGSPGGQLVCATTHLTLFAAIWRGITSTIMCSQALLLTEEGIKELLEPDWLLTTGALMFWVLMGVLVLLLLVSIALDCSRRCRGGWTDEYFLIPMQGGEENAEEEAAEEGDDESKKRCCFVACCCSVVSCLVCPFQWCWESSAVRDALDDVVSNWIENFAEIRDFVEGLCEGLSLGENSEMEGVQELGRGMRVLTWMVASLVVSTARRQASLTMGLSHDVLQFLTEDEDLKAYLNSSKSSEAEKGTESSNSAKASNAQSTAPSQRTASSTSLVAAQRSLQREQRWRELHETAIACVDKRFDQSASWCSLPCRVSKLYFVQLPLVSTLMHNMLWSSSMRSLIFMTDILGSVLMGTIFFQVSGAVLSKKNRGNCTSNDPREQIGRLVVIGVVSVFVAGIPSTVLASLHSRSFKKFEYEGCPAWKRQLRVWRIQDAMLWFLGLAYVCFCIFFILVFLANTEPKDQPSWVVSGTISFVEDVLVIPLAIAILVPLMATFFLSLLSCCKRAKKRDLLRQRRVDLDRRGNWQLAHVARV